MTARHCAYALPGPGRWSAAAIIGTPTADADNKRLNDGVVANVYTMQHQAGCTTDIKINPQAALGRAVAHRRRAQQPRSRRRYRFRRFDGRRSRAQRRLRRGGRRDDGHQSGTGDQRHRVDQPVVPPARLQRDHVGLRQRRHRCVVGEPDRPHGRGGGLRQGRRRTSGPVTRQARSEHAWRRLPPG